MCYSGTYISDCVSSIYCLEAVLSKFEFSGKKGQKNTHKVKSESNPLRGTSSI